MEPFDRKEEIVQLSEYVMSWSVVNGIQDMEWMYYYLPRIYTTWNN